MVDEPHDEPEIPPDVLGMLAPLDPPPHDAVVLLHGLWRDEQVNGLRVHADEAGVRLELLNGARTVGDVPLGTADVGALRRACETIRGTTHFEGERISVSPELFVFLEEHEGVPQHLGLDAEGADRLLDRLPG